MNVLDTVRAERPDVAPLDPATRAELRQRVVGTADRARRDEPERGEHEVAPVVSTAPSGRGSWLTVAAILIAGLGLAAVIVTAGRPWSMPPAAPPSTTADRGPLYPSATVPVVESMPDPLVIGAIDPPGTVEPAPTTAVPEPPFTPLALAEPPAGYELESATYVPGTDQWGMATYVTDSSTTQIWLLVTSSRTWFDQLPGLGRTTWQVGDVTVYDDGEGGGGCLVDVCSIGWAWDDETYVSLKWVEPNAGTLAAGSTHATLLALVPQVVERADIWQLDDPPPTTAPFDGTEELLLPGDGQEVETVGALVAGPGGTSAAALVAPDGSMVIVRLLPNAAGAVSEPLSGDVRSFAGFDLLADDAGTVTLYEAIEPCWMLRLFDGGSTGTNRPWRDQLVELAAAIDADDDGLVIGLPSGWTNLGLSGPTALHDVTIRVPGASGPAFVQVTQGPGSAVAFTNALAPRLLQVEPFLGGDAWVGVTSIDPVVTTVLWQRAGTSYVATSEHLDAAGIEAVVADMQQGTVSDWNARYGAVGPPADEMSAGPGCPIPTISISGG